VKDTKTLIQETLELEKAQRYAEALKLVEDARRANPPDRLLAIRHAQLLEVTKQIPRALAIYRSLIDNQPQQQEADLLIGLGRCLLKSAQYEQAAKLFAQVQAKLPRHPDVLTGLAGCRRHKGALNEAERLVREALAVNTDFKPAIHELAEIQVANKNYEEAVRTLDRNVLREDLYGDSLDLWLAQLRKLNRDRFAQEQLEALARKFPQKVEFIYAYGVLAHRAGEISIARPALEKANRISPNNYRILYELGVMERVAGNIERSQELIGQALALNPDQPAALRTYGNDYHYVYGDKVFTRLNVAAARLADVPPFEQVHLHYALAKAYEDVNELDTAFRHYGIGGEKKRRLEPYNERDAARIFQILPQVVTAQTLAASNQRGCESEVPVFILGMPRSGTSLMEQILSSHPDIFGAGELKFMTGILDNIDFGGRRIKLNDAEPVFSYEENAPWDIRGQRYVDKLEKLADKPYKRIVDKMPGNFNFVGMIHAILPNAKIIHSRRHPMETCLSCYRIHFAEGQQWSYNLRELGRFYKRYWDLMQHWREQFPGVMYEVRYEDNVADVEGQARGLIDYLGLEWNDNCLNFYNTDRPVKTASASQVRKPIYTTSTNRWRKYEPYLKPLLEELGPLVEAYEAEIARDYPVEVTGSDATAPGR
jgi:tetratricopeptide (TPR) repeat protein